MTGAEFAERGLLIPVDTTAIVNAKPPNRES